MRPRRAFVRSSRWTVRLLSAGSMLLVLAGCSHNNQPDTDTDYRPDPIPIHVKNENFLDMNVSIVGGSTVRRLGPVPGNGSADFSVPYSVANGTTVYLAATPIGGSGVARSAGLNVSPGQVIEFKIGSVLRQSIAVVHDP